MGAYSTRGRRTSTRKAKRGAGARGKGSKGVAILILMVRVRQGCTMWTEKRRANDIEKDPWARCGWAGRGCLVSFIYCSDRRLQKEGSRGFGAGRLLNEGRSKSGRADDGPLSCSDGVGVEAWGAFLHLHHHVNNDRGWNWMQGGRDFRHRRFRELIPAQIAESKLSAIIMMGLLELDDGTLEFL